ncbi:MAG: polyphosphate kinase 1, partial [Candidatus Eremiobacteraeota bacterium]|nr:polyphosphate kinase 1 [Candidatus Eremiobacteraeota bacterium]
MLVPTQSPADTPLDDPSLYFSRELSWLEFNDRVLEEAIDERNPLLERLKFIAIFSTNLDEYFMIRVAALKQQVAAEVHKRSNDGRLPEEQIAAISERLRRSLARFAKLLRAEIFPALEREGIAIRRYDELSERQRETLGSLFDTRVFPVLTPLAVDQGHPFPYISNLSLSLGVEMYEMTDEGPRMHFARVKVPQSLPRLVPVDAPQGELHFVTLEDIIAHNLPALFPGMEIRASYCFRVTRDADLDLQEDEADDLLRAIESELRKRRFGEPVRLEVEVGMPDHLRAMLLEALSLGDVDLYALDGLLGANDLWAIVNLDRPDLHDAPFTPSIPKRLLGETDIFAAIREGDLLLHHPYDSFDPVVQFIKQAANDRQVLAIKQTLYRTSGDSPVVNALVEAAENGKQVAALIELKARFDEENNIHWARNLERVGAHVVYGFPAMKVHAKVILVVRDEPDGIRRYVHFGTGNYNDKTAKVYTDLSLFTCRPELGADVTHLFNRLTGFSKTTKYEKLLVAPTTMRAGFFELIERETEHARAGRPSGIVAKLNAISDARIVRALYAASQAGVPIELIVRGMCELRPGIPGVSETIRVRSIVGRFLEHSRIFCFANG